QAALLERAQEALAARGVGAARASDQGHDLGVAPEAQHEPLQDVADPAGPALLATLDAGDGELIAGEHREAEIRAERLRDRARRSPCAGPREGRMEPA